jgi:hypothetical protein
MKHFAILIVVLFFGAQAHANCPTGTLPRTDMVDGKPLCTIKGSFLNTNLALTASNSYVLEGDVRIGADNDQASTLTLEPGVTVYGAAGAYLVIMRGSKILANGTDGNPVVFTSLQRDNLRPGLWGGLVINGNARINNCKAGEAVCESISEGIKNDPPKFGGNNDSESSGRLKYVRVEFAGFELAKDNELNGITFNAVGDGTEVDYVQVHKNADDGIEMFGGAVNLKHILLTDNDDDGMDWDMGWRGKAQFVMIELENGTEDSNGIEADNLKSPMTAEPRSNPILSNVTIVAKGSNPRLFNGILLRRGTGAQIYNTIVTGDWKVACMNLDDEETFRNAGVASAAGVAQTGLVMTNSIVNCGAGKHFEEKPEDLFSVAAWFQGQNKTANQVISPMLLGRLPAEASPAVGAGVTPKLTAGSWQFTPIDYIGALSPYDDEDWTKNWTTN